MEVLILSRSLSNLDLWGPHIDCNSFHCTKTALAKWFSILRTFSKVQEAGVLYTSTIMITLKFCHLPENTAGVFKKHTQLLIWKLLRKIWGWNLISFSQIIFFSMCRRKNFHFLPISKLTAHKTTLQSYPKFLKINKMVITDFVCILKLNTVRRHSSLQNMNKTICLIRNFSISIVWSVRNYYWLTEGQNKSVLLLMKL